jgi:hypothetical protein
MPVAERPTEVIRGQKTICIPGSQQEDEQVIDDPERFRNFLDRHSEATPERFPAEIRRGDRRKDSSTSRKTGWKLRRIELRDLRCFLVRPSFLMPYRSGRTQDVQAPLSSASAPSRTGREPRSSAARPGTGTAGNARWDATAW